ncbi:hypothetical protein Tco_1467216 [Tanacetum coccineum]
MDEGRAILSTLEPATNEEVDDVMPDDIDNFSDGDDFYDDFNPLFQEVKVFLGYRSFEVQSNTPIEVKVSTAKKVEAVVDKPLTGINNFKN